MMGQTDFIFTRTKEAEFTKLPGTNDKGIEQMSKPVSKNYRKLSLLMGAMMALTGFIFANFHQTV